MSTPACPDWDVVKRFLELYWAEAVPTGQLARRLEEVRAELAHYGTYRQTTEEIAYGAKLAWRNNTRCIGRLHWRSLEVRDLRHLVSADEVFEACVAHIRLATNGGKIKPMISVFAPCQAGFVGPRIWNSQLIRYAGFRQSDGSILGDPSDGPLKRKVLSQFSRWLFKCQVNAREPLNCRGTPFMKCQFDIRPMSGSWTSN